MTPDEFDGLIKDLPKTGNIRRWTGYKEDAPEEGSISYGDLGALSKYDNPKPEDYYEPPNMMYSDYSGSLVEASNVRAFLGEFANQPGVFEVYGGHGTSGVVVRLDSITDEMMETFGALESYPLLDENLHSEMEMVAQDQAWENWAQDEFKTELGKIAKQALADEAQDILSGDEKLYEALESSFEDVGDTVSDDQLFELFREAQDKANEEWINEQGTDMWIKVESVAEAVGREGISEMLGAGPSVLLYDDRFAASAREFAEVFDREHPKQVPSDAELQRGWQTVLKAAGVEDDDFETETVWRHEAIKALDNLRQQSLAL